MLGDLSADFMEKLEKYCQSQPVESLGLVDRTISILDAQDKKELDKEGAD